MPSEFFTVLSFVVALVATVSLFGSYSFLVIEENERTKKIKGWRWEFKGREVVWFVANLLMFTLVICVTYLSEAISASVVAILICCLVPSCLLTVNWFNKGALVFEAWGTIYLLFWFGLIGLVPSLEVIGCPLHKFFGMLIPLVPSIAVVANYYRKKEEREEGDDER